MRLSKALPLLAFFLLITSALSGQKIPGWQVAGLKHTGGVHFYLSPGGFEMTLYKTDGKGNPDGQIMHALLFGPDGGLLDSVKLYGTSEANLKANIKQAGVYTLITSMNNDQQMRTVSWGFRSNARHFMMNSSAGHMDRGRREPIVLEGRSQPFSIFFKPPKKKTFLISGSDLPPSANIALYGGDQTLLQEIPVREGAFEVRVDSSEGGEIWELRLSEQAGTFHIEGLTYGWEAAETPLPVWTSSRENYFNLGAYHWLLSPRRFAKKVSPDSRGSIPFSVFNNSEIPMDLDLSLADAPAIGVFQLSDQRLTIPPGSAASVELDYNLNSVASRGIYDLLLIAEDRATAKQAFSRVEFRLNNPDTISLPIQLKLFEHGQFQFAYEPDYPRDNQFYFDSENRPWLVTPTGLKVKVQGHWQTISLPVASANVRYPGSTIGTDRLGYVYTIVELDDVPHLLRVNGTDQQAELVPLPPGGHYKMETYMGGPVSAYPPVVLRFLRKKGKGRIARWARVHDLELFTTRIQQGKLIISDRVLISDNCVGISDHSGITNSVASEGSLVHLVWGETSDPKGKDPGVPTYMRTLNRETGQLSRPVLLAYSPPVNDVHNMSSILIDRQGNKHVVIGAHGRPFQYLKLNSGDTVWSTPKTISKLGQTYVGAVLDRDDGLHLFSRTWRKGSRFPGIFDASLYMQHKPKGTARWGNPLPFALPALPGYTVYYHRLTVDRNGKLYLSMDYWPTWSVYRESYLNSKKRTRTGKSRLVFTSEDGISWELLR